MALITTNERKPKKIHYIEREVVDDRNNPFDVTIPVTVEIKD